MSQHPLVFSDSVTSMNIPFITVSNLSWISLPSGILSDIDDLTKAISIYNGNLVLSCSTYKLIISPDHSYACPWALGIPT